MSRKIKTNILRAGNHEPQHIPLDGRPSLNKSPSTMFKSSSNSND